MSKRHYETQPFSPANDVSPGFAGLESGRGRTATLETMREKIDPPTNRIDRATLSRALQLIDSGIMGSLAVAAFLSFSADFWPILVFLGVTMCAFRMSHLYVIRARKPAWRHMATSIIGLGLAGIATIILVRLSDPALTLAATQQASVSAAALLVVHTVYAFFMEYWARSGRLAANVVIVGATANARRLIDSNDRNKAVNILGIFDDRKARSPSILAGAPYLGTLADLTSWPHLQEVDRIIVTVTPHAVDRVQNLITKLSGLPQPVCLLLDFEHFNPKKQSLEDIANAPAARLSGSPATPGWIIAKRLEDLVIGSLMFVAALPVMAVLAVLIKLDSPGPVLFRQKREGFNGRLIEVLKFRSMRDEPAPRDGAVRQVERDDPRVTRLGRFIRSTSLDELPQLWNVLKGEMSLVGPRPHAPGMKTGAALTSSLVGEYAHRHRVKPGLTGWAQVNGSRGPLHSPESARERIRYDVEYISKASLWFDLWIMLKTGPALLGDKINVR
ncbi:exopolysaccharide biosynthesis polyprenyl glycosylphosphotransferase [Hyphobacterium sp. CCMP332]|uniref:exopolysaccharide biosynthesis polyprenyl glycosylphosphotransferase n=1 Tax=Hyphobacterium sp. CCMP332 TaxID=2749086 RepID=UPI0016501E52|nr:exopolysaccharide biosynthesis polyprenyl glycosylphosphotransferase [Hyphobacterium sp. CCMP332]QNL18872.1 exopolysaccharide biosynthesis polyprenyl glycosylphosphotransferase [Hyphobacterium sp. CCMP332]